MKESEFRALLALQQKELVVLKRKDFAKRPFWRAYVIHVEHSPKGTFPTYLVWEESTRSKAIRALIKKWYRNDRR